MAPTKSAAPSDVLLWLQSETADLWPAMLGSLSLRRSPCVRENCRACQSGEQHPSYVLYGRLKGRPFAVYVPEEMVTEVRQELGLSRTPETHRRRIHAAPVHGILLPAGAQTSCV